MKYKNIIWDLDGTLMNTLEDLADATNFALRSFGMPERTIEEIRQFVGNGIKQLIMRAVPDGENNPQFETVFSEFKEYYMVHCQDHTDLYPGIAETLRELSAKGFRMAIVSNKIQEGVSELYNKFFSETIAVAVGERPNVQRKPAPDMVRIAMEELGCTEENTIYIGDSDVDIMTARNSGLQCISVLWGFRDKEFLSAHGADRFAILPADIIPMVEQG
ncbi:MAG: HAD family hydrolase [Bacteroidales bacterium]|nr:HAD family hydrolase [Bacteroidales bacterium]MCM1147999.1 HAD family hydrolase [Bacteroidales bacterium]MCM1206923.1 HAD family hydrolase [Bacillota bacterium]MCM1509557.1 HAD family hydrolase [Clostridium sp.]